MSQPLLPFVSVSVFRHVLVSVLVSGIAVGTSAVSSAQDSSSPTSTGERSSIVVDEFEDDEPGTFPDGWVFVESEDEIRSYEETRDSGEIMEVREEDGNRFVRLITENAALRYTKRNGVDFDWNLNDHPRLSWRWRAHELPEGASEKGKNDTGGALYVTFGKDWLGRPKSIKYTYSSSLPVGTTVSFGPLKVIVVDSAREPRSGEWKVVQRRIRDDYRQVFGGSPPDRPVSITLWSDSDTTGDEAMVDIDDIKLLPPR